LTDIPRSLSGFAAKPVAMLNLAAVFTIVGLGLKAGLVPFHAWLPDAHSEAPTPISAILSGVVVKTGAYALFLILFSIYGVMSSGKIVPMLFFLAAVSMIFGAVMALVQTDVKRLLAYSTVSQMGYVFLGISYASAVGVEGGLFHILNHSVFKVSLFLCAGNLAYYTGTRNMRKMGGLARRMPLTAFSFAVAGLAMAGVPPFNGFWSKLLIYYAGLEQGQTLLTILAIFASAVTLAYVVKAMNLIFFAELPSEYSAVKEHLDWMTLPSLCLAVLCIIIGLFPDLALQVIRPAAQALLGLISRF
jgi:multicomponent Na+:H+ antiporter subunit D